MVIVFIYNDYSYFQLRVHFLHKQNDWLHRQIKIKVHNQDNAFFQLVELFSVFYLVNAYLFNNFFSIFYIQNK